MVSLIVSCMYHHISSTRPSLVQNKIIGMYPGYLVSVVCDFFPAHGRDRWPLLCPVIRWRIPFLAVFASCYPLNRERGRPRRSLLLFSALLNFEKDDGFFFLPKGTSAERFESARRWRVRCRKQLARNEENFFAVGRFVSKAQHRSFSDDVVYN